MARRLVVLALVFVALGCGSAEDAQPTVAQQTVTAGGEATVGRVDSRIADIAGRVDNPERVLVRIDGTGAIGKLAVTHRDETELPEARRAQLLARFPGAQITHVEDELYADVGRVHEVEVRTADGQACELSMREDGVENYTECQMAITALPAPVAQTIEATVTGEVVEAEVKRHGDEIVSYTVEVRTAEGLRVLVLTPDGAVSAHYRRIDAFFDVPVR